MQKSAIRNSTKSTTSPKPEILTSGFIDIVNNGQVNASARFLRLFIGEPGKWAVPLSVYSGVSGNHFQNQQLPGGQRSNEHLVTQFINPLSGLANISLDGIHFFRRKPRRVTRAGILTHGGVRILTGYKTGAVTNPATGRPVNFLSSFGAAGLYFQTGAWERSDQRNAGLFWLTGRYIITQNSPSVMREFLPDLSTNGFYHGWSLAWGIEITQLVNLKVIYYQYRKAPELDFSLPIYQFSFQYALR